MRNHFRFSRKAKGSLIASVGALALGAGFLYLQRARLEREQPIRVGFSNFPPYVIDTGGPEPMGLAVEVIAQAAHRGKIPIRWTRVADIDGGLRSKVADVYPLATLLTQRTEEFHTSAPWWENDIALISLEDKQVRNAAEANGKNLGIRGLPVLQDLAGRLFPQANLIIIPRMEDMLGALCGGRVDAFFLDLRLLESQLLKGRNFCGEKGLRVASVPGGSLSLGTLARPAISDAADRLFEQIAELSADGTLAQIASRWSLYNSFQSRHIKDALDAHHRAQLMRYGLAALLLILLLVLIQGQRVRRAHRLAEASRKQAEASNQRFDTFMHYMPAVAYIKDSEGKMAFVNDLFSKMFELPPERVIGKLDHELWPKELADQFRKNDLRVLSRNEGEQLLETAIAPNGESRSFLSYKFPFTHPSGERFVGGVSVDITDRLRAEEALKLSQFSIDCTQDTMVWIDQDGRVMNANQAACGNLGYAKDELTGLHISAIDPLVDEKGFYDSRKALKEAGSLTVESVHRRKDGSLYPVEIHQNFLAFQGAEYSCCMCRDITERKQAERELARQARQDALTGLPNRRLLDAMLAQTLLDARPTGSSVAVVFLDLDGFKLVNDTLGHALGDRLLQLVALRLRSALPQTDMLFRMGGDEFAAVLSRPAKLGGFEEIANSLMDAIRENYSIEGHDLTITASIGISVSPRDGDDGVELLRKADAAMYESKRQGKNKIRFFTPEMGQQARERLELESNLRRALERDEFSLVFQPEFDLQTGKVIRHEALLRWTHPMLGEVSPSRFIPVAEDTNMIVPIGKWVLEQACIRAQRWQSGVASGVAPDVGVAVNVSFVQFFRPDFLDTVIAALNRSQLPAQLLELELTESAVMHNVEEARLKIARLRKLGVGVSIDDFGTGYSSLSYLQKLPVGTLKIDRSFVTNIVHDKNAASLTAAMVSLAHSLGMTVVVEGIEDAGQLAAIRKLGCEAGQGFYLGMPSSKPDFAEQLCAA